MDVPVGVTQQAISPDLIQWPTSVQVTAVCFGDPGLCAETTVFVKGVEGKTRLAQRSWSTEVWEVLDGGLEVWITINGKLVNMHDTMDSIRICDLDTARCHGRLRGGAYRYRQPPQDIPGSGGALRVGKKERAPPKKGAFGVGVLKARIRVRRTTLSLDPVVGFPKGLHHLIRPSRPIVEQDHESASRFCWCEATELPPSSLCPGNKRLKLTILVTLSLRLLRGCAWIGCGTCCNRFCCKKTARSIVRNLEPTKSRSKERCWCKLSTIAVWFETESPSILNIRGLLNDMLDQNQLLQQEIGMLRAQVAAASSAPQVVVPPMPPPGNPPTDRPRRSSPWVVSLLVRFQLRKVKRRMMKWKRKRMRVNWGAGFAHFWRLCAGRRRRNLLS